MVPVGGSVFNRETMFVLPTLLNVLFEVSEARKEAWLRWAEAVKMRLFPELRSNMM